MSKKLEIIEIYKKLHDKFGREPTMSELKQHGISRKTIRYHFDSKQALSELLTKNSVEDVKSEVVAEEIAQPDLKEEKKKFIINAYLKVLSETKRFPVYGDFIPYGITSSVISSVFGNISKLKEYIVSNHDEEVNKHFTTITSILDREHNISSDYIGKRYIVTTAVADFKVHKGFMDSLKNYAKAKDAEIVILPCESVTNSFEDSSATFDKEFNDPIYKFVTQDLKLNENLFLCSIQVSAKQIKATTGLTRLGKRDGSYIFASPKQFLDYKPSGNNKGNQYSIMTTGSCTMGDYFANTVFVSKRLSYIADHDHILGAVIVEVEDAKHFHFRQIQADNVGSFIDLGVKYNPDGSKENVPMNIVLGDLHGVKCDSKALNAFIEDFKHYDIKDIFIHDLFDGYSISHHVETIAEKYLRVQKNFHDLATELTETGNLLNGICYALQPTNAAYIVKSNHDEFLTRYLQNGRYVNDPQNHRISLEIAIDMLDGDDVLRSGLEKSGVTVNPKAVFLQRDESIQIGDVELGSHGDLGVNGAKPSLNGFEEVYGNCVVGHNHTAAIQRGVFRVGTMSELDMSYNRGPSSWTQTNCIIYDNGQRQLVNFINGKYYM